MYVKLVSCNVLRFADSPMLLGTKDGFTISVFVETNVEQEIGITVRSYPAVRRSTWKKGSWTMASSRLQDLGDDTYRLSIRATSRGQESYTVWVDNGQHTATFTVLVKPEGSVNNNI